MSAAGYKGSLTKAYRPLISYMVKIKNGTAEGLELEEVRDLLPSLVRSRTVLLGLYNAFDRRVKKAREAGNFIRDAQQQNLYYVAINAHIESMKLNEVLTGYNMSVAKLENIYYEHAGVEMPADEIDPNAVDEDIVSEFDESETDLDLGADLSEDHIAEVNSMFVNPVMGQRMVDTPRVESAPPVVDADKTIPAYENFLGSIDSSLNNTIQEIERPAKTVVPRAVQEGKELRKERRVEIKEARNLEKDDMRNKVTRFPVPLFPVKDPFVREQTPHRYDLAQCNNFTLPPRGQLFAPSGETPIMHAQDSAPNNLYECDPNSKDLPPQVPIVTRAAPAFTVRAANIPANKNAQINAQYDPRVMDSLTKQNEMIIELQRQLNDMRAREQANYSASSRHKIEKAEILDDVRVVDPPKIQSPFIHVPSINAPVPASTNSANDLSILHQLSAFMKYDARVKPLEIPVFSGNAEDYSTWWGLFKYAIHDNLAMDDLEKLMRLKAYTSGQALAMIKRQPELPKNYSVCVEILKKRYDRVIDARQRSMAKIEEIKTARDDPTELRDTLIAIQSEVLAIQDVEDCEHNTALLRTVLKKFPNRVREKLIQKLGRLGESWTMTQVFDLADEIIREFEWKVNLEEPKKSVPSVIPVITLAATTSDYRNDRGRPSDRRGEQSRFDSRNRSFSRDRSVGRSADRPADVKKEHKSGCGFCGAPDHHAIRCNVIKDVEEKRTLARQGRMCYLCLSSNHFSFHCAEPVCVKCKQGHHVSLCTGTTTTPSPAMARGRSPFRDIDQGNNYRRKSQSPSSFRHNQDNRGAT